MTTRILVISETEREAVKALVDYACKPENIYRPAPDAPVPGDNPNFVLQLWDYRCVFTITDDRMVRWRHLTISVPAQGKLPNPAVAEEIAHLFGITGTCEEWASKGHVAPHRVENCIVVVQEYCDPQN